MNRSPRPMPMLSFSSERGIDNREQGNSLLPTGEKESRLKHLSSWLVSFAFHIVVMMVLAMILFRVPPGKMVLNSNFSEQLGDQLEILTTDEGNISPTAGESYQLEVPQEFRLDDILIQPKEELPFVPDTAGTFFDQTRIDIRDMLSARSDPGTKNDLLAKYGGDALTSEAVLRGLRWLAKQQDRETGSWSLTGPYSGGRSFDNKVAATGLALLAFLGDGHTRSVGTFQPNVKNGWRWLLRQQKTDGGFYVTDADNNDHFYGHAISTIALCELLAMERSQKGAVDDLQLAATKAIGYLLANQTKEPGGWRYTPGLDSDLSVTGWCLMALQTARMAQLDVPQEAFDRISRFLDLVALDDGSQYVYSVMDKQLQEKRPSMTATGLLCRLYLGWNRDDPKVIRGADILVEPGNLIRFPAKGETLPRGTYLNVYGWYSASMVLKHLGPFSKQWRTWNSAMCDQLPTNQIAPGEPEAGSWDPKHDEYGFGGGRLYVTALSILCLEVYYRHLGLFR